MEYLLQLAEDETVRRILATALETPVVQGVVLDLDPFWLQCWRLHLQLGSAGDRQLDRWFEYWYYERRRYGGIPPLGWSNVLMEGTLHESPYFIPSRPLENRDLKSFPGFWKYYAQEMGVPETGSPVVVKICLRPAAEKEEQRTPEFGETRFRVVYETRPVATLYGSPRDLTRPLIGGLSIGLGPKVSGTLGGILQDSQGNRYGMTGIRRLVIGGLAVTYRFRSYTGEYYCFKNLFELRWPSYWRVIGGSPVESGDSGAWVCNPNSSGFGWCGMVVGGDRLLGYAQFSETVQHWWNVQTPHERSFRS